MTSHLDGLQLILKPDYPLEAAETNLRRQAAAEASYDKDREALLKQLAWLVDLIGRIAQARPHDPRYQAGKARALLRGTLKAHRMAMACHARRSRRAPTADAELHNAAETLQAVAAAADRVMWRAGHAVDPTTVRQVQQAAADVVAWARSISERIGPLPEAEPW